MPPLRLRSLKSVYRNQRKIQTDLSSCGVRTKIRTTESDLLKQIKATLEVLKAQGLISYRRIHVMPVFRKGRVAKNPDQAGMEDLQIYLLGGRTLYWELKSPTGKQSEKQKERQAELTNLGHDYKVIRSLDQALSELGAKGLSVLTLEATW